MKKKFFYLNFVITAIIVIKCSDNVTFDKNDINKYPWLANFTNNFEMKNFEGTHNTDLGLITFYFSLSSNEMGTTLSKIDSVIIKDEWSALEATNRKRLIIKEDLNNNSVIKMKIELDEKSKCLLFEIK